MDVYSRLMDIDEVVECLNRKTDTDISFDKKKVLKLIENRIITIVFKFEGFVTWDCVSKGKYYSIEMSGYFNFTDESKAIGIFEGSEPPRDCRRLNILREYDNEKTNLHS